MHRGTASPPQQPSVRRLLNEVLATGIALAILLAGIARPNIPATTLVADDEVER